MWFALLIDKRLVSSVDLTQFQFPSLVRAPKVKHPSDRLILIWLDFTGGDHPENLMWRFDYELAGDPDVIISPPPPPPPPASAMSSSVARTPTLWPILEEAPTGVPQVPARGDLVQGSVIGFLGHDSSAHWCTWTPRRRVRTNISFCYHLYFVFMIVFSRHCRIQRTFFYLLEGKNCT